MQDIHYTLLTSHFGADNLKSGDNEAKIKRLFDKVSRNIFEAHITMYRDIGELPFIYNERMGYAAIASSLFKLSPYVISEYPFSCKDNDKVENKSSRAVDFWYMSKDGKLEVYIESKHIHQSLKDINLQNHETIKSGLQQIYDLKNMNVHTFNDCHTLGLMLLSLCFYATPTLKELPNFKALQKETLNSLEGYIDYRRYMGILCSGVDISGEITKAQKKKKADCFSDYGYYEMPYLMLVGFVVEMPQ